MNIAGAHIDGFGDDQITQPHDGRAFLGFFRLGLAGFRFRKVNRRLGKLHQHRVDRFGFGSSVIPVDRVLDRFFWRADRLDISVNHKPKLIDHVQIVDVDHCHAQPVFVHTEWDYDIFASHRLGNHGDDTGWDVHRVEIDELVPVFLSL